MSRLPAPWSRQAGLWACRRRLVIPCTPVVGASRSVPCISCIRTIRHMKLHSLNTLPHDICQNNCHGRRQRDLASRCTGITTSLVLSEIETTDPIASLRPRTFSSESITNGAASLIPLSGTDPTNRVCSPPRRAPKFSPWGLVPAARSLF